MSESAIKDGDRITVEGIPGERIAQVHVGQLPPAYRKRGGRKPGSKNRPKADQGKEVAKLKAEIAELQERLKPKQPENPGFGEIEGASLSPNVGTQRFCEKCGELYKQAFEDHRSLCPGKTLKERADAVIALLERGALIRVSAMDSDSRLTAKIRELQGIASEAAQILRGAQ